MSNDPDDPVVLLDTERTNVDPGSEARIGISVRNPTTIVEEYALEILGPAAAWSTIEPARMNVMPGSNATATIVLSPPRVPPPDAGDTPFAVRCLSQLDRANASVVEADVIVGGFTELLLQVAPTTSKGILKGKHRVVLINRGNLGDRVRLSATDSADELRFKFDRDIVDVPPTGQVEAKLMARPPATFLKGQPKQHRFEVAHGPILPTPGEEPEARPTAATYVQKPWLSPFVVALLALAAIIAVLVGVLMSMRDDPASRAEERPPVVAEFSTPPEATAIDSVRLAWTPVAGAQRYLVERIPAGGAGTVVVEESQEVSGDRDNYVWSGLQPATDYCFRVVAETASGRTQPSASTCVKTLEQAAFAPPSNLLVTPLANTDQVQLTWTPSGPDAAHIVFVDDVPRPEPIVGGSTQFAVTLGATHCFTVAGQAPDGSQTEQASKQCLEFAAPVVDTTAPVATPPPVPPTDPPTVPPSGGSPATEAPATTTSTAPPTTTTTAGGTTTSTTIGVKSGWMVVLENFPTGDSGSLQRAQTRRQAYEDAGVPVNLAPSTSLGLSGPEAWALYVDGLPSEADARSLCQELRDRSLLTPGVNCVVTDRTS